MAPLLLAVMSDDFPGEQWSGVRRGPLRPGERVRLTDPKGRNHSVLLTAGKTFFTHKGSIEHDELIGTLHHEINGIAEDRTNAGHII